MLINRILKPHTLSQTQFAWNLRQGNKQMFLIQSKIIVKTTTRNNKTTIQKQIS